MFASLPSAQTLQYDAFDVQALSFDKCLIEKLAGTGPRYTSYPTADRFEPAFGEQEYRQVASVCFEQDQRRPLSLYVHIPFCNTICYYCACNKILTKDKAKAEVYLDYLEREIALKAALIGPSVQVVQLHLGGGTPTFLSDAQLSRLMATLRSHFEFAPDAQGEYSIEIDPRKVGVETVALLGRLGFNRMSVGVQDFDPDVQAAVNRLQSEAETLAVMKAARAHGFRSVSIDLIYGLPKQTLVGFDATLDKVIAAQPDRLSIYNYAHLPQLFKPQRRIASGDLPSFDIKLDILSLAIDKLTAAGYVYIGMDHFALPDDELAIAQRAGTLQRNFQGYSTRADIDLLGFGVSAISKLGDSYSQNVRTTEAYYTLLEAGRLPLFRGLQLQYDDKLRRDLIQRLMCQFAVDLAAFGRAWAVDFLDYFAVELPGLERMASMGLLSLDKQHLQVLPRGRLLVRNIAMLFDRHLRQDQPHMRYSMM
ncbi:oxygen-independent coproporphyrinogen III oxidase [Chitinimonas sp. BJB300]|uniref:oxygen-independent coproporphyrinogen III oxidase n=1 Tax=Chitinimonas sp. BJB300 TaxID=1559339 RepID=UPI000C11C932|nr:oxygen-independent coproporphyrinogen III oxidase [Chitinimonas sp. BJB300]PHV12559.1 oxygen-independent coproporphyrinogen III oxidase [Chitinimonas sp. BJB300]TSJ90046.1 oxygen-independent coproporphyrinogen III oxidase [Chitinimonas sp. BJB300]